MRALGKRDLPDTILIEGKPWKHEQTVKHDFWAATGFYQSIDGHRAVFKVSREEEFAGLPLIVIGRWLCRRETRFYRALSDLPNVPRLLCTIGPTGLVHEFVEGLPLSDACAIPDTFFDELLKLIEQIHARKVAYVDTNKPQNILLGDDGHPHLIDFQISYDTHELFDTWLNRRILRQLQKADLYHVLKHKVKLRPDLTTAEERRRAEQVAWFIRLHRWLTLPYFRFRRSTFSRLRASGRLLHEGTK